MESSCLTRCAHTYTFGPISHPTYRDPVVLYNSHTHCMRIKYNTTYYTYTFHWSNRHARFLLQDRSSQHAQLRARREESSVKLIKLFSCSWESTFEYFFVKKLPSKNKSKMATRTLKLQTLSRRFLTAQTRSAPPSPTAALRAIPTAPPSTPVPVRHATMGDAGTILDEPRRESR